MFGGFLKSKFYWKCKLDLKMTRTRIDLIRKKRIAMKKYLRNDVADLLRNGLDANAMGRAEGLLVEMNRSSCYEFVDQCCEHISSNLSAMGKERECPEESREAVSSLMFAAARFADLPELREIRTLFSERYVKSLDRFINKEFSEKLKSDVVPKDLKLQLLQEIAAESGLYWDSKALENKLFNESTHNKNFAKVDDSDRKKDHRGQANKLKEANSRNEDKLPKKMGTVEPIKNIPMDTIQKPVRGKNEDKPLNKSNPPPKVDDSDRKKDHRGQANKLKEANSRNEDKLPKKMGTVEPIKNIPMDTIKKPVRGKNEDKPLNKSNPPPKTVDDSKPVPKSVRRRSSSVNRTGFGEKKTNREKAVSQGQRILRFFDEDGGTNHPEDDEKMMDKLLQLYSMKNRPSSDEKGKGSNYRMTNRLASLPIVGMDGVPEGSKKHRHKRSSSFQDGMLRGGHVHPKLPDYDDFVSRLEALRGNPRG